MNHSDSTVPRQIVLHQRSQVVELVWPDGAANLLSTSRLRQACRCSACQAATPGSGTPLIASTVELTEIRAFGVAGIQCIFSDGHDRGVYPWAYLRELGQDAA